MSKKDKKLLMIGAAVIAAIIAIVAGALIFVPKVQDNSASPNAPYQEVQLPANSRELTAVREAPVNRFDTPDDDYIGVDMRGNRIVPGEGDENARVSNPDPQSNDGNSEEATRDKEERIADLRRQTQEMRQVSNVGMRFKVPSVGLDVPLGAVNEVNGVIRPTNFTNAFYVRNHGVKPSDIGKGTVMVALHATDAGGVGPGNFLVDINDKTSSVNPGEIIEVGRLKFRMEKSFRMGKELVSGEEDIWSNEPNRLVVLTCFPNSNDNLVMIANKV